MIRRANRGKRSEGVFSGPQTAVCSGGRRQFSSAWWHRVRPVNVIFSGLLTMLAPTAFAADTGLVIQVLRGAGANNNAVTGGFTSPMVRIVNSNGTPVAGALVVFMAPSTGASVDFAGNGNVAQTVSDETGSAPAPSLKPVAADGQVEIRVMATKEGRSANASHFRDESRCYGKAAADPPETFGHRRDP